ncbi:pyridoxamine 5'-phosphate oxidase family protein [Sporomusa aerivorans]|uniref:pyridoxamine 5'-phosphate oxidase family protein n=1 Tax=Sporomusa aerivorans TaxID=204936 RepID=UPI00352A61B7
MFANMRRSDRQISNEDAIQILKKCEFGVLSTVNKDDFPYGVPLSYVYADGIIYFHCANEGYKLDNIAANSKVSFCVVGDKKTLPEKFTTSYESVIVFGQVSLVEGREKQEALLALVEKYAPDFMEKGKIYAGKSSEATTVIKLAVEHMTGKVRPQ